MPQKKETDVTEAVTEERSVTEEESTTEAEEDIDAGDVSEEYLDYDDYFETYKKLTVKVYTSNNITYFVVVRIVLSFFEKGELSCVQLKRKWIIIYFIAESREGWMVKRYEHIRTI
jgi:hypothetical protein